MKKIIPLKLGNQITKSQGSLTQISCYLLNSVGSSEDYQASLTTIHNLINNELKLL